MLDLFYITIKNLKSKEVGTLYPSTKLGKDSLVLIQNAMYALSNHLREYGNPDYDYHKIRIYEGKGTDDVYLSIYKISDEILEKDKELRTERFPKKYLMAYASGRIKEYNVLADKVVTIINAVDDMFKEFPNHCNDNIKVILSRCSMERFEEDESKVDDLDVYYT